MNTFLGRMSGALPVLVGVVLLGAVVLGISPRRTEASINYQVNPGAVCNWQYPSPGQLVGFSSWRPWDAYSLYCYKWFAGDPTHLTALGGLNIQGYCSARYRGSRAVVINNGWYALDDWYCRVG
jgi:hypothetical protein